MYDMSLVDFYQATPRETFNIIKGKAKVQAEEQQTSWEQMRWQTWWLVNVHIERNKRLSIQDLARFPWEKKQERKSISLKDIKNFLN